MNRLWYVTSKLALALAIGGVLAAATAGLAGPGDAPRPSEPTIRWGRVEPVSVAVSRESAFNPDGNSLGHASAPDGSAHSIPFSQLSARLEKNTTSLNVTRIASLRKPVTPPAGRVLAGFRSDLRGFCSKDQNARVVVVADLGGALITREFPYGKATGPEGDFTLHAEPQTGGPPAALSAYVANVAVFLERRDAASTVLFQIDSLDITPILARVPGGAKP